MDKSWEHLLGGYATDTLTSEEKRQLFEAALQDQDLFNALADEEALKALLTDPEVRLGILSSLEAKGKPYDSQVSDSQSQWMNWFKNAPPLAWAGSIAALGLALIFGWQMEKEWGPEVRQAENRASATSDKTEERVVRLAERVIQLEEERAKLALKTKEEQVLRARQQERLQEKARAFKSLPSEVPQGQPMELPSAGPSSPRTSPAPQIPEAVSASAEPSVPKKLAPLVVPNNEVGQLEEEARQAPLKEKVQQFANVPQALKPTEPQATIPNADLTEVLPSKVQRDEVSNVEVEESKGSEAESLKVEGQSREISNGEVSVNAVLDDGVQKSEEPQRELLKAEIPGEEVPDSKIPGLASAAGEGRQDADLTRQIDESKTPGDELHQSDEKSSSDTQEVGDAIKDEQLEEVAQSSMSELDDQSFDRLLPKPEDEEQQEDLDLSKSTSVEDQYSKAQARGIRYHFVLENSGKKEEAINPEEFPGNWQNLRLVIESNVSGHLYVLTSYAEGKWQWVKPLFVTKPGIPGGGISLESFKPLEFPFSQLTNAMGKPLVSSVRVALTSEPLQDLGEAFGTRKIGEQQKNQILDGKEHRKYVLEKDEKSPGLLLFEVELED